MKTYLYIFILFLSNCLNGQTIVLQDSLLSKYYQIINKAELSIVSNDYERANKFYSQAYSLRKDVPVNDLYNRMLLLLKMNKKKEAYENYQILYCLKYDFDSIFFQKNFPTDIESKPSSCNLKLDLDYKKKLDSLIEIDQHYRKISKGDYIKYQKEISYGDSIASTGLLKLIQSKGFPNEYNIGVDTRGDFQKFYLIIWHQLAFNTISKQQVNFTAEIEKALNKGKITPNNAAFLIDLLNKESAFTSRHFSINEFVIGDANSNLSMKQQEEAHITKRDCCYVTYGFFPEKRTENVNELVRKLNENRNKIGLCSIDDMIKKNVFQLNNGDFSFSIFKFNGLDFKDPAQAEVFKKQFFKIK